MSRWIAGSLLGFAAGVTATLFYTGVLDAWWLPLLWSFVLGVLITLFCIAWFGKGRDAPMG